MYMHVYYIMRDTRENRGEGLKRMGGRRKEKMKKRRRHILKNTTLVATIILYIKKGKDSKQNVSMYMYDAHTSTHANMYMYVYNMLMWMLAQ